MQCICGHPEEDHEKGWGYCTGFDGDGETCRCVMFEEYEPELDDEEISEEQDSKPEDYDPYDDDELISTFEWPSDDDD